jgi:hypothetical protein
LATIVTMKQWGTMNDTFKSLLDQPTTLLGRIGADPARLLTVCEWWYEMDEPVATLNDPQTTFREDEQKLLKLCLANQIPYRPATSAEKPARFPIWLFRELYLANP